MKGFLYCPCICRIIKRCFVIVSSLAPPTFRALFYDLALPLGSSCGWVILDGWIEVRFLRADWKGKGKVQHGVVVEKMGRREEVEG